MTLPFLASGEFLTIGESGCQKSLITEIVNDGDSPDSDLSVFQYGEPKRQTAQIHVRDSTREIAETERAIRKELANPYDITDGYIPFLGIDKRFIRSYDCKWHHYNGTGELTIFFHDDSGRKPFTKVASISEIERDYYELLSVLHPGNSRREIERVSKAKVYRVCPKPRKADQWKPTNSRPVEKPVDEPDNKPTEKPRVSPIDYRTPRNRPVEKPVDKPTERESFIDYSQKRKTKQSIETPVEVPVTRVSAIDYSYRRPVRESIATPVEPTVIDYVNIPETYEQQPEKVFITPTSRIATSPASSVDFGKVFKTTADIAAKIFSRKNRRAATNAIVNTSATISRITNVTFYVLAEQDKKRKIMSTNYEIEPEIKIEKSVEKTPLELPVENKSTAEPERIDLSNIGSIPREKEVVPVDWKPRVQEFDKRLASYD